MLGEKDLREQFGVTVKDEHALLFQARHCEPTGRRIAPPDDRLRESIQDFARGNLDCFVAEFIIRPADGGTGWLLAMTESVRAHITTGLSGSSFR